MSVQKVGRGATYRRPVQGPATWAALIALGAALEAAALRGTPAGRVSFVSAWVALSAWFVSHILTDPEEGR